MTSQTGTGVGGNTPAAAQQAAQQAATTNRNTIKAEIPLKWIPYITYITTATMLVFVMKYYEWSFFWSILAASVLFYSARKVDSLAKGSLAPILKTITGGLKVFAVIVIGMSVLASSFVTWTAKAVDGIEACVGGDCKSLEELTRDNYTAPQQQLVTVPVDSAISVTVVGQMIFENPVGHCLALAPQGVFDIKDGGGWATYLVQSKIDPDQPHLATVKAFPADSDQCKK